MYQTSVQKKGFSLVEVIIVSALISLVFGALFSTFQYSLKLISISRAKLSAMSIANDRMEYFRSLPYDDVGTLFGIVPGTVPQNSTTTLNGIDFAERVLVEYVDDPADGLDPLDSNGIATDYKRVKLEYTWEIGGVPGNIVVVSSIVPRSIETTAGGGTARINVIDHNSQLLPGASVRLINASSSIDVTRMADLGGVALFSGAPAGSDYEVIVTGPIGGFNYSTDRTYAATTSNPNPVTVPFTVLEGDVSTLTFQIGQLSDLSIKLLSSAVEDTYQEDFSDLSGVASSSAVESNGSELVLTNTVGVYDIYGEAYSNPITPSPLHKWQVVTVTSDVPTNTSYRVYFLTGSGPYTLIPDVDLPGNSSGFSDATIDISVLDAATYPSIVLGFVLETSDTGSTPSIDTVNVFYRESEVPLANETFGIRGDKVIGTDAGGSPIYKFSATTTTDANGVKDFADIEFDRYTLSLSGAYDVTLGCPLYPYVQTAGVDGDLELVVGPDENNSLRVSVFNSSAEPIPGATVTLTRPGLNETKLTSACGQAYIPAANTVEVDYSISVSAPGYQPYSLTDRTIAGDETLQVTLDPV